tara:strand:- start:800 stop:1075 length:276 start_codon:yes stop_codon:yes gene_type:complete
MEKIKLDELETHYNLLFDYMFSIGTIPYSNFLRMIKNIKGKDVEQYRTRLASLQYVITLKKVVSSELSDKWNKFEDKIEEDVKSMEEDDVV